MSRILVFGLSGQVGDALSPMLHESDNEVMAVSRQPINDEKNIVWRQAGFENFETDTNQQYDAILSLGPLDAFSRWLGSSNIQTKKIIALSSTSIITKKNSPDPGERKLSEVLHESEQRLIHFAGKMATSLVIIRPTLIYGMSRDQSLSRWLGVARRFKCVVLPRHAAGLRQPVHVKDVADTVFKCLLPINSNLMILDLPGGEILPFDQMLLRSLHVNLPATMVIRVPDFLFKWMLRFASVSGLASGLGPGFFARLSEDWVFDAAPAEHVLGTRLRPFSP